MARGNGTCRTARAVAAPGSLSRTAVHNVTGRLRRRSPVCSDAGNAWKTAATVAGRRRIPPRVDPQSRRQRSSPAIRRLMPSYRGQLSDEQMNDLVAYIKSLGAARCRQADARSNRCRSAGDATD